MTAPPLAPTPPVDPDAPEPGAMCGVHRDEAATFTCSRCGVFGCLDCRFGGQPPRVNAWRALCRDCARGGLDEPIPWERRKSLGLWRAFAETTRIALTSPGTFFRTPLLERDFLGAALYGAMVYVLGSLAGIAILGLLALAGSGAALLTPHPEVAALSGFYGCLLLGMIPISMAQSGFQAVMNLGFAGAGTHGLLRLFGKTSEPFENSVRSLSYTFAPAALMLIPCCGWVLYMPYAVVLEVASVRHQHRVSADVAWMVVLGYRFILFTIAMGLYALMFGLVFLLGQLER